MEKDSLTKFIEELRQVWGPLDSKLAAKAQALMNELVRAPVTEPWLADLQEDFAESRELYHDPEHGFILIAHTEHEGLYRHPHNHGDGWVIYAVQRGEMEMGTYAHIKRQDGAAVVQREKYRMKAGESRVYLPGDIHDTKCISDSVLMFRLTSCDLKTELQAKRMRRYTEGS
ncbi:hypothetical protein QJS83_01935 [Bdellovibrio sp. 22V]|uniref:hypothetical protein n=1 Tax=Bdellovibrio sp. 22V TaxID=3044166 RepID=UPI002542969C|nr:hypothetical protein [Bdellovibrio sp. 22V]WII72630.1 hypothetical protein QJS83_01935 [Bdellovibrio sp. 22V]